MILLVTGGRRYADRERLWLAMGSIHSAWPITRVIHGGAAGADHFADGWAAVQKVPTTIFEARWDKDGRAAGPIRNQRMLDEGKPDLVLAAPGGNGTADMVRRAKAAGVRVVTVDEAIGGDVP